METQTWSETGFAARPPGEHERMRATLPVAGLACGVDPTAVERALQRAPGVIRAYVNRATEMAYLEYDPHQIGLDGLRKAIETVGHGRALPGGEPG